MVLPESRTIGKMPGPSVPITLLLEIVVVWVPAPRLFGSSVPTAMPAQPTALLALMKLLLTVEVMVTGPSICISMAMQSMFRIRLAAVPLLETLKLPWPLPVTPAGEEPIRLVADAAGAAVHQVAGDGDDVRGASGDSGAAGAGRRRWGCRRGPECRRRRGSR